MVNSRQKGAAGEREFVNVMKKHGFKGRRGQQFAGGADSPDCIFEEPLADIHFEVKRVQALNIEQAIQQSLKDAGGSKFACVAHRKNGDQWKITMTLEHWIALLIQSGRSPKESI